MSNKEIHRLNLAIASCLVSVLFCFLAVSLPSKFLLSLSPVYTLFKIQTLASYPLHYGEYMLKRSNIKHVYGIFFRKLGKYLRNKLNIEEIKRTVKQIRPNVNWSVLKVKNMVLTSVSVSI